MNSARLFYQDTISRQSTRGIPHAASKQSTPSPDLTLLFSLTLLTSIAVMLISFGLPKPTLENHPMCGVTTGGQDECYFDCKMVSCVENYDILVEDLHCLTDCFEDKPDSCVTALLNDIISNGVCLKGPGLYPVNTSCTYEEIEYSGDYEYYVSTSVDYEDVGGPITEGTCSDTTEALLVTETCLTDIFENQEFVINTLTNLIFLSCRKNIGEYYFKFIVENSLVGRKGVPQKFNHTKLAPSQFILEDPNIRTKLEFENTRHRYPWVCSLRSKGPSPEHRCAVNLLSIPPSPTVIVGAAHCTYLCKDGAREVPACCCSEYTDNCTVTDPKCGNNPGVELMGSEDSIILCGEWDTSQATSSSSGERYNLELPILDIVRHPDFDPSKGIINGNDIVIFKIDDTQLQNNVAKDLQLWPACLPTQSQETPKTGIHTGWSKPPSFSFVQSQAPGYGPFYADFYKQWHYRMDIFTCEDPKDSPLCIPLQYPSNSSYPKGTVCAKDFTKQSCFSTGDSGSPLMVTNEDDKKSIEGILSFVKGCDQFEFGEDTEEFSSKTTNKLIQRADNPATYTKLSCFLPWIAAQYNMNYENTGLPDPACTQGSGDPQDGKNTCRTTPSNWAELRDDLELECKFPFYYDGVEYDECILYKEDDFVYPVFRCPTLNITTKINGINSFNSSSLVGGICIADNEDYDYENPQDPAKFLLDPDIECFSYNRRLPFSQCKNNCPGVRAFGIIGGGAALAAASTVAALGTLPYLLPAAAVGVVGVAGVGGSMLVGQSTCLGPFFCTTVLGTCCLVVFGVNGAVCPDTCPDSVVGL